MNSLTPWRQPDGSIVDMYWDVTQENDALRIITQVNSLPAIAEKDSFLLALDENPIIIVQWETGSGKSTQLPKIAHLRYPDKHIVVTQPRRLSATSLAKRVSYELFCATSDPNYSLGQRVGYRTGVWKMASHTTKLWFHTDWTEGMRQTMSDSIPDILFIDEVHGFSPHTEVLAMLSRYHQRAMKLVIMSATLDPWIFRDYYREVSNYIPLISIPGRTFGVTTNFDAPESSFGDDLEVAIREKQNVIIFAPGKKEIETLIQELQEKFGRSAEIFPLHAEMSISEQNMLLTKTTTLPRIVVATNIAEESITIPYMYLVADFGTQKVLRYTRRGIPTLGVENTALANCTQRAWRVGRTGPGVYNRYNNTSSTDLLPYPEAPIQREMIDRHILTLLSEGIDIIDMIYDGASKNETPFFHHVDIWLFEISLTRLRAIWALTSNNQLTVLGHELLKFPVDVYHARMLYESIERQCTGNMVNVVSILEKKWFVSSKDLQWKELLSQKKYNSDLRAYSELLELCIWTTINSKKLKILTNLGINPDELKDFLERDGNMKLYEVVDLSPIGIKNKKIKEIDECREILIDRFASMWIELTNAWPKMSQSIAIASWYMHNVFVFDEEHEQFKPEKAAPYENYKQWNVSVVIPQPLNHYLGNPFIILGKGKVRNFSLLTQIMEVSDLAIAAARKSNQFYAQEEYQKPAEKTIRKHSQGAWSRISHDIPNKQVLVPESQAQISQDTPNTDMRTTQVLNWEIQPLYESLIREFQLTNHESSDDAQIFYLDNCLIPFLFEHNSHIKKYIARKSDNWKQFFSRLLIRFLRENDLYRINPNNIAKTESSFRHDADIIRRFQESTDSVIRDFRLHGIPKKSTNQLPDIWDNIPNKIQLEQVWAIKKQYAVLLWSINQHMRVLPLHDIEKLALEKTLKDIEEWKSDDGINQAYIEIEVLIQELIWMPEWEIREMARSVKQIWIKRKELNKNRAIHKKLFDFQELLKSQNLRTSDREKLIEALHFAFFVPLDEKEENKYITFVNRITSPDTKKRNRARENPNTGLRYYQWIVAKNIWMINWNIEKFEWLVHLDNCMYAKEILEKLWIIVQWIFHDDYIWVNMENKIYEMMRLILRDNITTKKWLYRILFEWLQRNQMGQHMNWVSNLYNLLVKHDDLQFWVDSYRQGWAIYTSMLASKDPSEIEWYISGLQKLLEQLQKSVKNVDENKLWQKYCQSKTSKSI